VRDRALLAFLLDVIKEVELWLHANSDALELAELRSDLKLQLKLRN